MTALPRGTIVLFSVCLVYLCQRYPYQARQLPYLRQPKPLFMSSFAVPAPPLGALLFDCDGVIAETERDVHRITFNQAFASQGLAVTWDVDLYGRLLTIGGGKERMTAYFDEVGWSTSISEAQRVEYIKQLHKLKTQLFQEVVLSGVVPPRPGGIHYSTSTHIRRPSLLFCFSC